MRPDLDLYFMRIAWLVATRSTCLRRAVGCILTDSHGRILSTGYNGVARGSRHCNEEGVIINQTLGGISELMASGDYPHACPGAMEPGGSLELCQAVHAEANSIIQCHDTDKIHSIYTTLAPCDSCLKLLLNTGAERLVIGGWYRDNEAITTKRWAPRHLSLETRE